MISLSPFTLPQATIGHHRPAMPSLGRISMFCSNVALMFCSDEFAPKWVWFAPMVVRVVCSDGFDVASMGLLQCGCGLLQS